MDEQTLRSGSTEVVWKTRNCPVFGVCTQIVLCSGPRPVPGIHTQSENTLCQGATSNRLYSSSIFHGTTRSPIAVRLDGLRKDCCGFCQEVERVGSDPICAGSLCLKVLHCNQSQSLTLTTLYRHTVKFCRIVDRLHICCDPCSSSIVPPLFVLFGFRIV